MTHLDFEFRLSRSAFGKPAAVRIWVDENHDGQMEPSEEVTPLQQVGLVWRGRRPLKAASAKGVAFLLKFQAEPGAKWRVRVWTDQPSRHLVYEEQDVVPSGGGRVIGWCRD